MRVYCPRCLKASSTCFCGALRTADVKTRVIMLQHPREYRNAIGTARMTQLSLRNSRVLVGLDFDSHPEIRELVADPCNRCVVLFPGPFAQNLSRMSRSELEREFLNGRRLVLIVLDGTWNGAKKIITMNPNLAALPQISFDPVGRSEYGDVRRQPREFCFSTVEAVHRVLKIIEPEVNLDPMLEVFRGMVRLQSQLLSLQRAARQGRI